MKSKYRSLYLLSFAALINLSMAISACDEQEISMFAGTWTGYLSCFENDSGYNTLKVSDDRKHFSLVGEISGERQIWGGPYKIRFEGSPYVDPNGWISGDVNLTLYRPGIDTTQATAAWWGRIYIEANAGYGSWESYETNLYACNGKWAIVRDVSLSNSSGILNVVP